jgi:1,2-diacylglycerol 3-alpha-glucosyltransferase
MYEDYVHYIARGYIITPKMAQTYSRVFCNRARAVDAPVRKAKEKLLAYGVKRPIRIIPTGIDFGPFAPENYDENDTRALKEELGISADCPVMLFIGRIAKEKSVDQLVSIMPKLLSRLLDLKFVIVGDGGARKELELQAAELGIADSVVFAGAKPWSSIGKYYRLGDIFVCASTSETQGLTYIEAMASKVAVVAKRDQSVEDILIDGETGFYFDGADDAPDVILRALSDKNRLKDISERAYQAIARLSSSEFGANVEALYIQTLQESAEARGAKRKGRLRSLVFALKNKTAEEKPEGESKKISGAKSVGLKRLRIPKNWRIWSKRG